MEKSIYKPLVGKYVQVDGNYGDFYGKLIQANERFLQLQPCLHIPFIKNTITREKTDVSHKETEEVSVKSEVDLEELTKRWNRNALSIIDTRKVGGVTDITTIFRDEWKLI